jgi:alpha-beta hydrolase superfamily lysophospholipase
MIDTIDGLKLHTKNWLIAEPKANLLLVHGLGEHSARYEHVAKALNKIGISVYSFDLRGHGLSEGARTFIKDIKEYRQDLETIIPVMASELPLYILGHSMGGLIVSDFLLQENKNNVKGVILTGPALEVGEEISAFKQLLIRVLNWISPQLKTVKLDPKSISRDSAEVEKYIADPLISKEAGRAGMGVALLNAIADVKTKFNQFDYPMLLMHGGEDVITNPEGSKSLMTQSPSKDKTLKIWDEAYHEIFNETNKEEVIDFMINWLKKRI